MTRSAYLTIDDSPSARSDDLVDALAARGVPAILFCRGDLLEQNPAPVIRAIQKGFVIGNHGFTHTRASTLGYDAACQSIDRADALIDDAYARAKTDRPGKYYRFAYMDRGMGVWFVEPDTVPPEDRETVFNMIKTGLGNDPARLPDSAAIDLKRRLQAHLAAEGYAPLPCRDIAHSFFMRSEMSTAIDAMFTFSTADWALTKRHKGRHSFETVDDLKAAIDADLHLARDDTAHIILAHDQADIHDVTVALVDHMLETGFEFKEIA